MSIKSFLFLILAVVYVTIAISGCTPNRIIDGKNHTYAGQTVKNMRMGFSLSSKRKNNVPRVGEKAPGFSLELNDGSGMLGLANYRDKSPVVLVFGSYT